MHKSVHYCATLLAMILNPAFVLGAEPKGADEVQVLIKQLVSRNKPPLIECGAASYLPDYDKAAQSQAWKAWTRLFETGHTAFPYLLEAQNDLRYCLTAEDPLEGNSGNYSVGQACRIILIQHLQPYGTVYAEGEGDPRTRPRRPDYYRRHKLHEPEAARTCWEARRKNTLRELQVEVLQWVIQEEAKSPEDYSDAERRHLKNTLRKLEESRDALKPTWPFDK